MMHKIREKLRFRHGGITKAHARKAEVGFSAAEGSSIPPSGTFRLEFQHNCLIRHHKETFKRVAL